MIPAPVRMTGVVKTWIDGRGYGFATPVQGGADVFVHVNMLTPDSARPRVGDTLRFEIELSPDGKSVVPGTSSRSGRSTRSCTVPAD